MLFIALPDSLVAGLASEKVRDLAPRRAGEYVLAHGAAIGGIGVLAVERSDPDDLLRNQGRLKEFPDVLDAPHAAGRMR